MLATHAVMNFGIIPRIFSVKQKSELSGAMYLHERIPYLTSPLLSGPILFRKLGDRNGYAEKVYGNPTAACSWDTFGEGQVLAYSLRQAYDDLWNKYSHLITDEVFNPDDVGKLVQNFDVVMTTVPAAALCKLPDAHDFAYQPIWVWDGLPEGIPDNEVWYNGMPGDYWYRASNIFGHYATEMVGQKPVHDGFRSGVKPLWTNCNCHPRFYRLGRFGRWEKGILTHHAFLGAAEIMRSVKNVHY